MGTKYVNLNFTKTLSVTAGSTATVSLPGGGPLGQPSHGDFGSVIDILLIKAGTADTNGTVGVFRLDDVGVITEDAADNHTLIATDTRVHLERRVTGFTIKNTSGSPMIVEISIAD